MSCPETMRVQAAFDDEVDALTVLAIDAHVEQCAECLELRRNLERLRFALRQHRSEEELPPAVRTRIMRALDAEDATEGSAAARRPRAPRWRGAPRSFWWGAGSGVAASAMAASLAIILLAPLSSPLTADLLNAHQRSLLPSHLIDVESTDRHTVKPWFAGHADVSPAVADFSAQGYRLVGGRTDFLDRQRAAVLVYRHGAHVINVFSWADEGGGVPKNTTRDGYHLAFWRVGDLDYCAVSDTGWDELLSLVRLMRTVE
jgi:anti-sigma factor RsiW